MTTDVEREVDPDPFGIGIGIFAAMVSGAQFLEARRQTQYLQQQQQAAFRTAWFEARRSLIFFKRTVDEFETYVIEDGYGRKAFRVGSVRLVVTARRANEMKRLRGRALHSATRLGDDLDELSNFLGPAEQEAVDSIIASLNEFGAFPDRYLDLITQGKQVVALYSALLDALADRQEFG